MMIEDENEFEPEAPVATRTRRRSTPAVKPEGMPEVIAQPAPEPTPKARPSIEDVKGIGGMVETRWAGIPMWQCPKCHGTTFSQAESRVHKCKRIKYADEGDLDE